MFTSIQELFANWQKMDIILMFESVHLCISPLYSSMVAHSLFGIDMTKWYEYFRPITLGVAGILAVGDALRSVNLIFEYDLE